MSIESAKAFFERMKIDEEFAKKITAETNAESRMALACSEGFTFTTAEIAEITSRELTDEELAGVVTYVRNSWKNNTNDLVQPNDVRKVRQDQQIQPTMVKKARAGGFK